MKAIGLTRMEIKDKKWVGTVVGKGKLRDAANLSVFKRFRIRQA
jgi:hypothetical protein